MKSSIKLSISCLAIAAASVTQASVTCGDTDVYGAWSILCAVAPNSAVIDFSTTGTEATNINDEIAIKQETFDSNHPSSKVIVLTNQQEKNLTALKESNVADIANKKETKHTNKQSKIEGSKAFKKIQATAQSDQGYVITNATTTSFASIDPSGSNNALFIICTTASTGTYSNFSAPISIEYSLAKPGDTLTVNAVTVTGEGSPAETWVQLTFDNIHTSSITLDKVICQPLNSYNIEYSLPTLKNLTAAS